MRFRAWIVAAACGLAVLAGPGRAEAGEAERQALAREIVELLDFNDTINGLFDTMAPMMAESSARELRLTTAETARLGEILAEEFRAAGPDFMNAVVNVYANGVAEEELVQIRDFLRTPAGRAMTASQGRMQTEMERQGQIIGMQVAIRAFTRLNEERNR